VQRTEGQVRCTTTVIQLTFGLSQKNAPA
jgi:hypothetical protein